ncbi:hypothetical protein BDA96_01G077800 [Sorghum bicolor]|uniref:Uncharacterized protein n=1 Tax=Sorghum bicolor TaxID=4558 RepID=A0A921RXN4_SORBI|nr:hypothetical protein BDA96_01G077800 [Sorghum bicolor]
MLGLAPGEACVQSSPSLSARLASPASYSPWSLASTQSLILPSEQRPSTQSTSRTRPPSPRASSSMGRRPHVTSRRNTPNANTSVSGVALEVRASSGARYPMVPTTRVVRGLPPWSCSLASPKSPRCPAIASSRRTLLALTSRWTITCSQLLWR